MCRFVTADNIVDGELSAIGWNRYAYVKGNPVVGKDPTGHANENSWLMDQTIGVSHEQHVKQQEAVNEVSSEIADKAFTVLTGGRADSGTLDPVDINGIDRTPALEVEPFDIYLLGKIVKGGLSFAKNKLKKSIVKKTIKNGNFKSKLKEALRGNSELGGKEIGSSDTGRSNFLSKLYNLSVSKFMKENEARFEKKLGKKISKFEIPFEQSKKGKFEAQVMVEKTLRTESKRSPLFKNNAKNTVQDIYSKTTGFTVRIRENGVFDTLIPNATKALDFKKKE